MEKTIYIITNEDKVLLKAYTNKKTALAALENKYKSINGEFYLELCSLLIDGEFIEEIKKL